MKLFKPYKVLLVLGNGFDLSLGLKTTYAHFLDSDFFKKWVQINRNAQVDLHDKNLFNFLSLQNEIKNWIDVEEELKKYATKQQVEYHLNNGRLLSTQNASDAVIKDSFTILCFALQTYIKTLDYSGLNEKTPSLNLLKTVLSRRQNCVVTFNYTDVNRLVSRPRGGVEYMHGNIVDGIILGFQRFDDMANGYEYMIKSENPLYKSRHLYTKMLNADEIIIYGHSLGETDHCYFKPFFEEQISNKPKDKRLTIVTLNRESHNNIIRQMVKLTNEKYQLFQDNTDVNFIETESKDGTLERFIMNLKKKINIWH